MDGGEAWVVHSGDNTVGRLSFDTGKFDRQFVDVGNDRNPWDALGAHGRLYVSNFLTGSITIADRASGAVLGEVFDENLVAPSGLTASEDRVFVASSGYVGPGYEPPAVVVFDVLDTSPWLRRSRVGRDVRRPD